MSFQLFSPSDSEQMAQIWRNRSHTLFTKKVVDDFVDMHIDRAIKRDLHTEMFEAVKNARSPKDLAVSSGLCYDPNYRFYVGNRWMSIKQLIYRTDALQRLAAELGPKIKVRPSYWNGLIYIMIEFWPNL
jgi:hypothetical protein